MHGSVVFFCLYEDYEKIEFCVISLDRICIRRGREGGGGVGVSFMLFGGDLGETLLHIALNQHASSKHLSKSPGGVLGISSDGDDRMEPKVKTQKNP